MGDGVICLVKRVQGGFYPRVYGIFGHREFALSYDPEQEIIVMVGSSEAVDLAPRAVIDPGDEVLIPAPSYIAYEPITHLHGGKIVEVAATIEEQLKLTPQALQAAITPHLIFTS